jgi:Uma2 family endonuclease
MEQGQVAALISEAEYLATVYEPDAEFVDGVIEERNLGENEHSAWQMAIAGFFFMHAVEWNIRVRPELRNKVADRRYRVPDVALLDFDMPQTPIAVHPPLTIFEVVSPEDRYKRLMVRLSDFSAMGVKAIYVVDPETGAFSRFEGGQLLHTDVVLCRDVAIDVREIARLVR